MPRAKDIDKDKLEVEKAVFETLHHKAVTTKPAKSFPKQGRTSASDHHDDCSEKNTR